MFGPALALLLVGAALSFTPELSGQATQWAQRFQDRPAHAAEVLAGRLPPVSPAPPTGAGFSPYGFGIVSTVLAVGFAAFGLYRRRLPALARRGAARLLDPRSRC